MAEQKFKVGDRVKITDCRGTIVGTKLEDNSIKYHVKIDQGRIYTWVFQNSLEHMVKGTIVGDVVNKPSEPKITDEQRTVLEGLYLLGYRYLACDESNHLYAYNIHPWKDKTDAIWFSDEYSMHIHAIRIHAITNVMNNLCFWEDEKPTSIEWLLGKKVENE